MNLEPTLLFDESTITSLLNMHDINTIVDQTFQDFGKGNVINPKKVSLDLGETGNYPYYEGFMNAMPAYVGFQDIAGQKWVGGFLGERKEAGLPYITGMIMLVDPHLGHFISVMEGSYISNMRTGAQAACAIDYLFRKPSITIGMYGAGMQARKTIEAIADRLTIDRLIVWNHRRETAEKFKEDMTAFVDGDIIVTEDGQEAAQAEVLITLTPAQEPIIKTEWVNPGTVVMPMGSFQEIEDSLILNADKIVVDHIGQALTRGALKHLYNQGNIDETTIYTTIGEHSLRNKPLPNIEQDIVLCIPIGTGAMDVACAYEAYKRGKAKGLGTPFNFLN